MIKFKKLRILKPKKGPKRITTVVTVTTVTHHQWVNIYNQLIESVAVGCQIPISRLGGKLDAFDEN